MSFSVYIIQKTEKEYAIPNGGYHTLAESVKEEGLVIEKNGVQIRLTGKELAQLYNTIRPVGSAPRMEVED